MATREQLHREVDALPEPQVGKARIVVEGEPEVVGLPAAWKSFEDGRPQPNWTALIREDRDHGH